MLALNHDEAAFNLKLITSKRNHRDGPEMKNLFVPALLLSRFVSRSDICICLFHNQTAILSGLMCASLGSIVFKPAERSILKQ
jgi:hypothetical protein